MIESRCGIVCSDCEYKEKMNCGGCISIENPFWGTCDVKACCEKKNLDNCGMCGDFPCDLLNKFSYDEQEGDDGMRVEQCKKWCDLA
ncbi:DUF3795 domain-containing protein [Acidaminobacter sp. JC074]|uniref:DUF3795 domain-containing protein n=1 Tax=Acidaminobacter sp. JC074 TaxID=2530199 RepID=UPI001F109BF5|nr:DUF3795 domain-containing protein [Acidaminobacter sp. JC074]MCH4888601.1 DUF3795 domain-containing protein [Acidaminobacter sp. JC074]